ncbi:unnamed protein product [Rangifer tarandus platyrhynchus]|uniref:Uncharacterized protein n=2 Tax=Rangifer tarandus platyrhynchus TaxID=3082113 RepID=A0ACB0F6A2_RANTA|nr:unnamed protein product [Rangifer tarandus platyrhynchus]CAI9708580.1 unnamed protein product [Rangifer tarandus platyrhynchus]
MFTGTAHLAPREANSPHLAGGPAPESGRSGGAEVGPAPLHLGRAATPPPGPAALALPLGPIRAPSAFALAD